MYDGCTEWIMSDIEQAVLLAAGKGSRLAPLTDDRPKCLVEVAGVSIADNLCHCLDQVGVRELIVVTGYCADVLRRHLGDRRGNLSIRYIDNPDYATTNNIYSLWLAADAIEGGFQLLESDIFCQPELLASLLTPDLMAVSRYTESMSGTGVRLGPDGAVTEVVLKADRAVPDQLSSLYKTVNFYSFSGATWSNAYRPQLARWIAEGQTNVFYEAALAELINRGELAFSALDISGQKWAEIDDHDDLAAAEALFATPA